LSASVLSTDAPIAMPSTCFGHIDRSESRRAAAHAGAPRGSIRAPAPVPARIYEECDPDAEHRADHQGAFRKPGVRGEEL
jgi:hypothetical protein